MMGISGFIFLLAPSFMSTLYAALMMMGSYLLMPPEPITSMASMSSERVVFSDSADVFIRYFTITETDPLLYSEILFFKVLAFMVIVLTVLFLLSMFFYGTLWLLFKLIHLTILVYQRLTKKEPSFLLFLQNESRLISFCMLIWLSLFWWIGSLFGPTAFGHWAVIKLTWLLWSTHAALSFFFTRKNRIPMSLRHQSLIHLAGLSFVCLSFFLWPQFRILPPPLHVAFKEQANRNPQAFFDSFKLKQDQSLPIGELKALVSFHSDHEKHPPQPSLTFDSVTQQQCEQLLTLFMDQKQREIPRVPKTLAEYIQKRDYVWDAQNPWFDVMIVTPLVMPHPQSQAESLPVDQKPRFIRDMENIFQPFRCEKPRSDSAGSSPDQPIFKIQWQ